MGIVDMLHAARCTLTRKLLYRTVTDCRDGKDFCVKLIELQKIKRRVTKRDRVGSMLAARDNMLSANRYECSVRPHVML